MARTSCACAASTRSCTRGRANCFGFLTVPTLWAAAHKNAEGCATDWAQREEESLVLSFQAYLNNSPVELKYLQSLRDRGMSLDRLKGEARELLRAA